MPRTKKTELDENQMTLTSEEGELFMTDLTAEKVEKVTKKSSSKKDDACEIFNPFKNTNSYDMRVRITFFDEVLGLLPSDPDLYENYIASKAPDARTREQDVEEFGVEYVADRGITIFPRNPKTGNLAFKAYHWKGYFKEACSMLKRSDNKTLSGTIKAFKKEIDGLIFILEDYTDLIMPEVVPADYTGLCERTLRASTPQGTITSIATSESMPIGTTCEFTIRTYAKSDMNLVREWLNYGAFHGTGQWRNANKGRFVWEEIDKDGNTIDDSYKRQAIEALNLDI